MPKRDPFDSAGQATQYISLDRALILAQQLALQDAQRYKDRLGWDEIVWVLSSSEQREDSYRVVLSFRDPRSTARSTENPESLLGSEEFVFNHLGELEVRQVLQWPPHSGLRSTLDVESAALQEHDSESKATEGKSPGLILPDRQALPDLKALFEVTKKARQFFMDLFVLGQGEVLILEVPVTYGPRSRIEEIIEKPDWDLTGVMGVTNTRLLFAHGGKKVSPSPTLPLRFLTVLGRPTEFGIEIRSYGGSPDIYKTVFIKMAEPRDTLVQFIQSLVRN